MKSVLVTGGAGYLGSVLTQKLIEQEYNVTVIDNLTYSNSFVIKKQKKKLKFINNDVRDLRALLDSVNGSDVVIHLAAIVGDPATEFDPHRAFEINFLATKMLMDCCKYHSVNQFIFASTCSAYGNANNRIVNEKSKLSPVSFYAKNKIRAEQYILENIDKKLTPTIMRTGTLFGLSPRMRFDLVINLFVALAIKEKKIMIEGGNQWRPFIHVSDAADAYISAIERPRKAKGVFNTGSYELNEQIINVGKYLQEILPETKLEIKKVVDKRTYQVDFSKIEKRLKFKPTKTIKDGIEEIVIAFKKGKFRNWHHEKYFNNKYLAYSAKIKNSQKRYYFA